MVTMLVTFGVIFAKTGRFGETSFTQPQMFATWSSSELAINHHNHHDNTINHYNHHNFTTIHDHDHNVTTNHDQDHNFTTNHDQDDDDDDNFTI